MTKIGLIIILLVVVFLFLRSVFRTKNLPLASPLGVPPFASPLDVPPFASPEQTDFQKFVERIWYNGDIRGE